MFTLSVTSYQETVIKLAEISMTSSAVPGGITHGKDLADRSADPQSTTAVSE
jgi:hypothetical protein